MKELPKSAQVYLFCVYAAAITALCGAFATPWFVDLKTEWGKLLIFIVISVAAGHFKISIMPGSIKLKDKYDGTMSLGFAMIFATLLHFGPQGAVLAGIATTITSCLKISGSLREPKGWKTFRPRAQPAYQFAFNVSVDIIGTSLASLLFVVLNQDTLTLRLTHSFAAIAGATLLFFFVNTGAVATIIALCSAQKVWDVWRDSFLWTAPSYFIGAAVAPLASAAIGNNLPVTVLCAIPAFLTYQSYKNYTDKQAALLASAAALATSKDELATLYLATIRSLALAIDAKDQYTHKHILRVQKYSVATAKHMGFAGEELKAMETGALLHDIGKLGVPEYVLLKPGRLTDDEFEKIKQHPNIGADILDPVTFPWPVLPIVKHHHERMDGTGYPDGLKGEEIPLSARVLAVADVYDAVTSSRSYRAAWSHERAVEEIRSKSGTHFDPQVVEAFCAVIDGVLAEEKNNADMVIPSPASAGTGALPSEPKDPATTVRSAEAARRIQRASSELWALYEVAQTLSASLGISDTLEILARKLNAIFPETGCVFLLRDFACEGAQDVFVARSAVGLNSVFFEGCKTLGSDSLSLQVARDRRSYLGVYDHDDLMPNSSSGAAWQEIGTALIVPIVHQGETLGTINLYHADPSAFAAHDQYLLEMIGERAALALYNGLLFDRTKSDAITDALTGLFNVRHFTECVEERIRAATDEKTASGETFALLCLDLDCFKPINDNFGHQRGDRVLCDISQLLLTLVEKNDVVSRYGGDEFLILLHAASPSEAANTAWRIQETVTAYDPQLRHPRLGDLRIDVSVGVACYPDSGSDSATLLSVADAAMYANKTERKLKNLAGMERNGGATVAAVTGTVGANGGPRNHSLLVAVSNIATASNNGASDGTDDEAGERALTAVATSGATE